MVLGRFAELCGWEILAAPFEVREFEAVANWNGSIRSGFAKGVDASTWSAPTD